MSLNEAPTMKNQPTTLKTWQSIVRHACAAPDG